MPTASPNSPYVQNSFIGGLKTEFTGLNFPENACTSVSNFVFTITGDCTRRGGFDFEANYSPLNFNYFNTAIVTYKWNNAGGDGFTELVVQQVGTVLYFYKSFAATVQRPLSSQFDVNTVSINAFQAQSNVFNPAVECQFADGNGVLFVYHPTCDPFYITYSNGRISATKIDVQIRDFLGMPENGVPDNYRPPGATIASITQAHLYNLYNQGWTTASWTATTNQALNIATGSVTIAINTQTNTTALTGGAIINLGGNCTQGTNFGGFGMTGTVTSYVSPFTSVTLNITYISTGLPGFVSTGSVNMVLVSNGNLNTFGSAIGNMPSNSDVWWRFINSAGAFSPGTMAAIVPLDIAPAPKGHFIIDAFNQNQPSVSGASVTPITTPNRPSTGCFFQDRIWYSGVNGFQDPIGTAPYYTWTENIYFSQMITSQVQGQGTTQFGQCFQTNDPTSNTEFNLLPTDGGVIVIEGSGQIYKLFAITNGLLVFAANGIWFITGSTGLGFAANDYTVAKISSIRCISGTSFVNVLGYPVFWNAEGIWTVTPNAQAVPYGHGGLSTENLCVGTILTYFQNIPLQSKKYARGDFDPITYNVTWVFKSINELSITTRYQYDSALTLNTINRAFYPYSFPSTKAFVNGIIYVSSPGGSSAPQPVFKYPVSYNIGTIAGGLSSVTFAEERDFTNYVDFISIDNVGTNYTSQFLAGYNLHGGAIVRWCPEYVYLFLRGSSNSYLINGVWDYASDPSSGRIPSAEYVQMVSPLYGMQIKRHRIRGRGYAFQLQIQSIAGQPLDLMGWSIYEHKAIGP